MFYTCKFLLPEQWKKINICKQAASSNDQEPKKKTHIQLYIKEWNKHGKLAVEVLFSDLISNDSITKHGNSLKPAVVQFSGIFF